ncbi:MAG TPA: glycerol-3-phosphate dehydrogenase [Blastocatellia bacterium]|nr:glycerol-3-phosphate dehydrogenase [Blastocatellia bacterium]
MIKQMSGEPSQNQFDVVVIGAGINGAGIARDAARRGLRVLLLDKGDVGGGTSSWSTRLIHGGLRYLEHGEIGLVRESLRERECLLNIAPHLVRPLPILVPIYKNARRGPWTIRAGMFAYNALSFDKTLPRHRLLSQAETLRSVPALNPSGLLGAAIYFDAQVEFAERLVLENALSAIEHGAKVATYARVERLVMAGQSVRGVEFTVELTGARRTAQARVVINAAGPWIDQLLEKAGASSSRLIGGTKGSHIIVAPFSGAPPQALYVEAEMDHRPFFIIPWNHNYLIGTTDIRYDGDLDHVEIDDKEIEYLLGETNRVIPQAKLTREQILYTYSGVRPLPLTSDNDEQSITRRHFIKQNPLLKNLFSIVGGKLTTYRSLAQETVDLIFKQLARRSPKCTTAQEPLPGAATATATAFATFARNFKQESRLAEAMSHRLLRIYGTRSPLILSLVQQDSSLAEVFDLESGAIAAEVVFAFKFELAQTLSDCLLRRTMVGLNSTCGLNAAEAAAGIAQKHLGWSSGRTDEEVAEYTKYVKRFRPSETG